MKKYGDPVLWRLSELEERPKAFEELGKTLIHYEKILQQYDAGVS